MNKLKKYILLAIVIILLLIGLLLDREALSQKKEGTRPSQLGFRVIPNVQGEHLFKIDSLLLIGLEKSFEVIK